MFLEVEAPRFQDTRHVKVVSLSVQHNGHFTSQEIFVVLISVGGCVKTQGHSAAGRIMSMKNSGDTIGNQGCNLSVCSALSQQTAINSALNSLS